MRYILHPTHICPSTCFPHGLKETLCHAVICKGHESGLQGNEACLLAVQVLKVFAPKGKALAGKLAPAIEDAVHDGGDNPSGETSSGKGYDQNQRRKLDDLVEKSR